MVTPGNTHVHLLTSNTPELCRRCSHVLGRLQCCVWNVFIPGTLL